MPLAIAAVLVGLIVLTKAADEFVGGAARLSAALNVPPVIIGAAVIGFGTSAPEMVVSGIAARQGKLDIAIGNIVGSNVANLSLVLGVAGLITVMSVSSSILRREAPLSTGAVILFAVLVQGGLEKWEGVALLVAMVAAFAWLFLAGSGGDEELAAEVDEFLEEGEQPSVGREVLRTIVGLVGVVGAAQATVWGATEIADRLNLGEGFIAVTLVALGTSLPELVTAIAAARQNEHDLIIGNLLGSNLFNSLAVGAVAALLGDGMIADDKLTSIAVVSMLLVSLGAFGFMWSGKRITTSESVALLSVYAVTIPLLA